MSSKARQGKARQGKVWINDEQYFDQVPLLAWEFYIGGYQPAQKWIKDRHGRTLDRTDIRHYLNIITALVETDRLMKEIDNVLVDGTMSFKPTVLGGVFPYISNVSHNTNYRDTNDKTSKFS